MDLVTMFLTKLADWGFGKAMDIVFDCANQYCRHRTYADIGNQQSNYLECNNCHRVVTQYTNACDFTINRATSQIGHGMFQPGSYLWEWPGKNFFYEPDSFRIPFDIRVDGLRGRAVILTTAVRRYSDEQLIAGHQSILTPSYDVTTWNDYWHSFHKSKFNADDRTILAVDARLESEFHDILFEDRRIIKPWK